MACAVGMAFAVGSEMSAVRAALAKVAAKQVNTRVIMTSVKQRGAARANENCDAVL